MAGNKTEQMFGGEKSEIKKIQAEAERVDDGGQAKAGSTQQAQMENGASGLGKSFQAQTITEEQARALLMQDKLETEQRMKGASTHRKKVLTLVIGAVIFLAVIGVAMWLIVGNRKGEEGKNEVESSTEVRESDSKNSELQDGEVAIDNEIVQKLYGQFEISPLQGFYGDELLSEEISGNTREMGRLEMALNQAADWQGETVRQKYQEMFGEGIVLTVEKYGGAQSDRRLATGEKFVVYNAEKDEFMELEGGTDASNSYVRRLERAEKEGDKLYLYERAVVVLCSPDPQFDEDGNQISNGSICGVLTVAATCGTPEFSWSGEEKPEVDEEILDQVKERGIGLLKWTFEKTPEGNYVFKGIERA